MKNRVNLREDRLAILEASCKQLYAAAQYSVFNGVKVIFAGLTASFCVIFTPIDTAFSTVIKR